MRKIFIALLSALSVFGLASCNETQLPTGGNTGTAEKTPEKTPAKPATKKTVIQYCGWDLGTESEPTLKRLMIEEFNKTSDTIRIDMLSSQDPLEKFYTELMTIDSFPDVFMMNSVPVAVMNRWALDVSSLAAKDPEWENIEKSLVEPVTYNGQINAIPAAQHYMGFLANYDLINDYVYLDEEAEVSFAPGAFTTDDFFAAVPQIKDINKKGSSVIGINAVGDMINWLPSTIDSNYQHFVWNNEKQEFDYGSETMFKALTKIQELGKIAAKNTFNSYADPTAEEDPRIQMFGTNDGATAFINGQVGFFQDMTSANISKIKFDYKFIGYPDKRVVSVSDFVCISKSCKNPEAAYEVAKYLTFGEAGIKARYKIVKENKDVDLTGLPVNVDPAITGEWFDYVEMEGVKEIYDQVVAGEYTVLVEGYKTIPGFEGARFTDDTGIKIDGVRGGNPLKIGDLIWDVCEGAITIGQYKSNMTVEKVEFLNKTLKESLQKMKDAQSK